MTLPRQERSSRSTRLEAHITRFIFNMDLIVKHLIFYLPPLLASLAWDSIKIPLVSTFLASLYKPSHHLAVQHNSPASGHSHNPMLDWTLITSQIKVLEETYSSSALARASSQPLFIEHHQTCASCFSLKIDSKTLQKEVLRVKLQVIEKKLQVDLLWDFWGSMPVGIWLTRDYFIPLTMQSIRQSHCLLIGFPSHLVLEIEDLEVWEQENTFTKNLFLNFLANLFFLSS